jgi:SAM-dependent methyltransferase
MLNRVLRCSNKYEFEKEYHLMQRYSATLMRRKPQKSLIQSAAILHHVLEYGAPDQKTLAVGSFEDVVFETLTKMGWSVVGTDPVGPGGVGASVIGLYDDAEGTLQSFVKTHPKIKFDLVFANSVIEHVADDADFFVAMIDVIAPGGVGLLTYDFKEGWVHGDRIPSHSFRFYTPERIEMFCDILKSRNCQLIGEPNWVGTPDFEWEGVQYSFAGLAFRKGN